MSIIWITLGVLSLVYGLMIMGIRSGSSFYMIWFAAALFFFVLAANRRFHFWQMIPGVLQKIVMTIFCTGIVLLIVIEALIFSEFNARPKEKADYVVVLGAQVRKSGPSQALQYRLDTAADYLKKNPSVKCIVSGGQGKNEPCSEAEAMRDELVRQGIESSRVIMEDQSENTVQNIQYSMNYLNPKKDKVCIVTNNFHVFRALKLARKQGIEHVEGLSAPSSSLFLLQNMLREFFGVAKDVAFQNM